MASYISKHQPRRKEQADLCFMFFRIVLRIELQIASYKDPTLETFSDNLYLEKW